MPSPTYDQEAVARVYSRALYPLTAETGSTEPVLEELQELAAYIEAHPEFDDFLSSPLISAEVRRQSLEKLFRGKLSDLLLDTLLVLNRRDRCGILRELAATFRQEVHLQLGRVDVEIRTAVPLNDRARQRITKAAADYTKRSPRLTEVIDEALIGGLVVQVEDLKIDLSLANDLRVLEQKLLERASEEIHSGKYLAE